MAIMSIDQIWVSPATFLHRDWKNKPSCGQLRGKYDVNLGAHNRHNDLFFFFKFGNLDPVSFHKGPKKPHLGSGGKKKDQKYVCSKDLCRCYS